MNKCSSLLVCVSPTQLHSPMVSWLQCKKRFIISLGGREKCLRSVSIWQLSSLFGAVPVHGLFFDFAVVYHVVKNPGTVNRRRFQSTFR